MSTTNKIPVSGYSNMDASTNYKGETRNGEIINYNNRDKRKNQPGNRDLANITDESLLVDPY